MFRWVTVYRKITTSIFFLGNIKLSIISKIIPTIVFYLFVIIPKIVFSHLWVCGRYLGRFLRQRVGIVRVLVVPLGGVLVGVVDEGGGGAGRGPAADHRQVGLPPRSPAGRPGLLRQAWNTVLEIIFSQERMISFWAISFSLLDLE